MVKDPVCGMDVNEHDSRFSTNWEGQKYYFCSDQCKQEFDREPRHYAGGHGMGTAQQGMHQQPGTSGMGEGRSQTGQKETGRSPQSGIGRRHQPEKKYGT
jgi:YHS domain-containing protein